MIRKHFFRMDSNARFDDKIEKLEVKFGKFKGFSLYFWILGVMSQTENHKIQAENIKVIAYSFHIKEMELQKFMDYCVEIHLFKFCDGEYYSERFLEEMAYVDKISNKNRAKALKRWHGDNEEPGQQTLFPVEVKADKNKVLVDKGEILKVFEYWNSHKDEQGEYILPHHKVFPDEMKRQIERRLKEYGMESVKKAIDNYLIAVTTNDFWMERRTEWTLTQFMKQVNAMPKFLTWKSGNKTSKAYKQANKKYEGVN